MGEAWHNNHHAFPGSARIGLYPGQSDWGYAFILLLERMGLASNIALPEHLARTKALTRIIPTEEVAGVQPVHGLHNRSA
jgi:stearoyl-CoA desaturase (delta-9 desaturase)